MSSGDIALFLGQLVSLWCVGFCAGYLFTKYKDALSHVS